MPVGVHGGGTWVQPQTILPCCFPPTPGTKLEATKSQMEYEALVREKIEKARAAVQCSHLWVM